MNMPRFARVAALVAAAAALVAPAVVVAARSAGASATTDTTTTVVSLTFDDGQSSHYSTLPMLQWRGMRGTYYINSDLAGTSDYYMDWPQVHELADAGNEIGGHTATHADLTKVDRATARRQICDDRRNLLAEGFAPVASFAYPYAARDRTAEKVVAECGYSSGRAVGDVACEGCPYAEKMPPRNAFALRAPESADASTTMAQLASYVTDAEENGGGWVVLSFHGICADECTGKQSLDPAVFAAFLDWLEPRAADGTVVRTVGEVMGAGPSPSAQTVRPSAPADRPPATSIQCDGSACGETWHPGAVTVSLSATDPDGSAVASTRYTTDGTDPATSPTAETYSVPLNVAATTTIRYGSADAGGRREMARSQRVRVDTAAPAVELAGPAAGSSYRRGTRVVVSATAADGAGGAGIRRVVFKDGNTTIGTDTAAPYRFTWSTSTTATLGEHRLTAVATDAAGNVTTSAPVAITLTAS